MKKTSSNIELILSFKKGDEKAFEILFQKYHKKLYAFLYKLLNSKEDAEEIVQNTFIKIWERREDFIADYSFESFLFTIAKNAFLNETRKRINGKIITDHMDFLNEVSSVETDDYVIYKETKTLINSFIDELPARRKEIFLLRRVHGLSRKEIADKLGISIITVDNQLTKATSFLKEQFIKHSLILLLLFLK